MTSIGALVTVVAAMLVVSFMDGLFQADNASFALAGAALYAALRGDRLGRN